VGAACGYRVPLEPGDTDYNSVPAGSSRSYSIPLSCLFSLARSSQLTPSALHAGARYQFLAESPLIAAVWSSNPTIPAYSISDLSLNFDTTQLSDSATRSISLTAASQGLSLSFTGYHTQESSLTSNSSDEIRKSVSRALTLYTFIRSVDSGANMWSTDFFSSPPNAVTGYGLRVGSLFLPMQALAGSVEEIETQVYSHSMKHLQKLGNGGKQAASLPLSKWVGKSTAGGGMQILCTSLERAGNLESSSGIASNNSRSIILSMSSTLPAGSYVQISVLQYESVAQVYLNNISIAS
jgi:hypothetical protein